MFNFAIVFSFLLLLLEGMINGDSEAVSLSLRGAAIVNDGFVDIDDIHIVGPNSTTTRADDSNSLLCRTNTTVGCCNTRSKPVIRAQWFLPNGSLIYFSPPVGGYRKRRNKNVVRLFRDINPPRARGRFYCEILDDDINWILYTNILDIGAVTITNSGPSSWTVGENFTLQCSADIQRQPDTPDPTFEWFFGPNNASLPSGVMESTVTNSSNTYTSTLQFIPLQEFHAGIFTCRLGGNERLADNINIMIQISAPAVAPGNFSTMPTNRKVQFMWTADFQETSTIIINNYTLTCAATVDGVDPVLMTFDEPGNYTLGGFRPATEYSCSVFAVNSAGRGPSATNNVTTLDEVSLFQLRLINGLNNCPLSVETARNSKVQSISAAVLENIQDRCQCGLVRDRITDEVFLCFPESPQAVLYRAVLHGTASASSSEIISHIEQWTAEGAVVTVGQLLFQVDGNCSVRISDKECHTTLETSISIHKQSPIIHRLVGAAVGVLVIIIIIVLICSIFLARKYHLHKRDIKISSREVDTTDPIRLNEIADSDEHHYECVDVLGDQLHHKGYEDGQLSSESAPPTTEKSLGDYELVECSAYGAIADF